MRVLARAYGDRPLVRELTGVSGGLAYVVNPSAVDADGIAPLSGVGFPRDSVFAYDPSLADSLEGAWSAGDRERLAELWGRAHEIGERLQ